MPRMARTRETIRRFYSLWSGSVDFICSITTLSARPKLGLLSSLVASQGPIVLREQLNAARRPVSRT